MTEKEKVIKGLKHCIGDNCSGDKWYECEYSGHGCIDALLEDALALLKAQEPRVLTLEEVKAATGHDVWLELSGNYADDVLFAATIEGCGTNGLCTRYESFNYSFYGIRPYGWRCWTSRPTDEQREATPWNAQK